MSAPQVNPAIAFKPDTAYAGSWKHVPGVRRAKLVHRQGSGDADPPYIDVYAMRTEWGQSDYQALGPALAGVSISCGWFIWAVPTVAEPTANALLDVLDGPDQGQYVVAGLGRERYGARWLFACYEVQD